YDSSCLYNRWNLNSIEYVEENARKKVSMGARYLSSIIRNEETETSECFYFSDCLMNLYHLLL
ncbi:hypothetical protein ACJX0J_021294, partial [Zea mays]